MSASSSSRSSEVRFGSFLVYPTKGTSDVCRLAKNVTLSVKQDKQNAPGGGSVIAYIAKRIRRELEKSGHAEFFKPDTLLVPMPRSTPLKPGALWPAQRIAEELVKEGLGYDVLPCLVRHTASQRASGAAPGERPTIGAHLATMRVQGGLASSPNLTIVDDVVTKGRSMIAATELLRVAFPEADIMGFAISRTLGFVTDVPAVVMPAVGVIRRHGEDADRQP